MRAGGRENEYRPSGGGRRDCGIHQGRLVGAAGTDSAEPPLLAMESGDRPVTDAAVRSHRPGAVARLLKVRGEPRCRRSAWAGRMRMWCSSRGRIRRRSDEPSGSAVTTLVVSGKTDERVASWASVLADWMEGAGAAVPLADVAHTLNHHRARHGKFATVCAVDRAPGRGGVAGAGRGRARRRGWCRRMRRRAWAGHGVRVFGSGLAVGGHGPELLADEPAFAAAVAELEPVFVEQVGFSLRQVLASRRAGGGHRPHPAGAGRDAVGADGVVALLRGGTRCGDRAFDGGGDRGGGGRGAEPGRRAAR